MGPQPNQRFAADGVDDTASTDAGEDARVVREIPAGGSLYLYLARVSNRVQIKLLDSAARIGKD